MRIFTSARNSWKLVACVLALGLLATWPLRLSAEESPRQVVETFMQALEAEDFGIALRMVGVALPDDVIPAVKSALARQNEFQLKVKGHRITDVKTDGGLSLVTVEETRFFDISSQGRAFLEQVLGPEAGSIHWGDARVAETFVLVKLKGKWVFDTGHSGLQPTEVPLTAFMQMRSTGQGIDEATRKSLAAGLNSLCVGRIVQTFGSTTAISSPMLTDMLTMERRFGSSGTPNARGRLTACKSNLKNIGTALEMYSTDNSGRFPRSLQQLTPNYLRAIPTCPSAGRNTYSSAFQSCSKPEDAYTVLCRGAQHKDAGQGRHFPQYTSTQGLISQ